MATTQDRGLEVANLVAIRLLMVGCTLVAAATLGNYSSAVVEEAAKASLQHLAFLRLASCQVEHPVSRAAWMVVVEAAMPCQEAVELLACLATEGQQLVTPRALGRQRNLVEPSFLEAWEEHEVLDSSLDTTWRIRARSFRAPFSLNLLLMCLLRA